VLVASLFKKFDLSLLSVYLTTALTSYEFQESCAVAI